MTLHCRDLSAMPAAIAAVGAQVLAPTNRYRVIGDHLADLLDDAPFAALYDTRGRNALSPALRAMVTLFQFLEDIPDREAAEQVVVRLDWKYALHLPLEDTGFDHSCLCYVRQRVLDQHQDTLVFETILGRGVTQARDAGQQRGGAGTQGHGGVEQSVRAGVSGTGARSAQGEDAGQCRGLGGAGVLDHGPPATVGPGGAGGLVLAQHVERLGEAIVGGVGAQRLVDQAARFEHAQGQQAVDPAVGGALDKGGPPGGASRVGTGTQAQAKLGLGHAAGLPLGGGGVGQRVEGCDRTVRGDAEAPQLAVEVATPGAVGGPR